ncbi:hypothetical protein DL96DRAFT_1022170 [Flagelloscypha sp. PMI_526]|nr:hypothetical protein DL96DRAFT_1022170 [Flagelloscypha sp. PMI_526]
MTVRAQFSSSEKALNAQHNLTGSKQFGKTIEASLPISTTKDHQVILDDTTVRVDWAAPQRIAYGGYADEKRAQAAILAMTSTPQDSEVTARIHTGLPVLGRVTVQFEHIPPSANEKWMKRFGKPTSVMFEQPNYLSRRDGIEGIKRMLTKFNMTSFDLQASAQKGRLRAYAKFASRPDAEFAAQEMHGRKPNFIGHTRIMARHVVSLSITVPIERFDRAKDQLSELQAQFRKRDDHAYLDIRPQPAVCVIRIQAQDTTILGELKNQVENSLRGEVLRFENQAVWDKFFSTTDGQIFINQFRTTYRAVVVETNTFHRSIRLYGPATQREKVGMAILAKWADLRSRKRRIIRLEGRVIGVFLSTELPALRNEHGLDSVYLDPWDRIVVVRGSDSLYEKVLAAVRRTREQLFSPTHFQMRGPTCPICLNPVAPSRRTIVACGHDFCTSCITEYLRSSVEGSYFPLSCLGADATCPERIPLSLAQGTTVGGRI